MDTKDHLRAQGAFSEGEEGEAAEGAVAQQQAQLCFLQALVKTPRFDVTMMCDLHPAIGPSPQWKFEREHFLVVMTEETQSTAIAQ